jgi:hypothetical protein
VTFASLAQKMALLSVRQNNSGADYTCYSNVAMVSMPSVPRPHGPSDLATELSCVQPCYQLFLSIIAALIAVLRLPGDMHLLSARISRVLLTCMHSVKQ